MDRTVEPTMNMADQGSGGAGGAGTATPATPGAIPVVPAPTTAMEIKVIRAQRAEISSQLGNVSDRRDDIASQIRAAAPGADRAGLENRLAVLDSRIAQLENDLNVTGVALASAKGDAAIIIDPPSAPGDNRPSSGQITAMSIVFFVAVLMPLAIAFGNRIVRRGSRGQMIQSAAPEVTQRLERMEEGIEAIAIEVERISEGQRFVTKLLGEDAAQPLAVGRGESVPASERRS